MRRLLCLLLLAAGAGSAEEESDPGALAALGRATERLLAAIDAEVAARLADGDVGEAAFLAEEAAALRRRAASGAGPAPSAGPEAYFVAVREGAGSAWRRRARVRVTACGRPVVLVLSSGQPVYWDVEIDRGVDLAAIYTTGHDKQEVSRARARVGRLGSTAAFGRDGPAFAEIARQVEERAGCAIWTLACVAQATPAPIVVGPDEPAWEAEHLHHEVARLHWRATAARRSAQRAAVRGIRFPALYHWRGQYGVSASFGDYSPLGPLLARHKRLPLVLAAASVAVRAGSEGDLYLLREGVLLCHPARTRVPEVIRPPDTLPAVREPCGVAIDSFRQRLLLATRHEAGYLYALDLVTREWSVVNDLDHVDPVAVAYDARRDSLFCLEIARDGAARLHRFRARDGERAREIPLDVRLPDPRDQLLPAACVDGKLVLLHGSPGGADGNGGAPPWAFVIEPHTGEVSYAAPMRVWEDFAPLTAWELDRTWSEMLDASGERAERAMRRLAGQGDAAVSFLARRLGSCDTLPVEAAAMWVELLGADDPGLRLLAHYWLQAAGEGALDLLASAERDAPSPEARRRAEAVRVWLEATRTECRLRRDAHAIRVLEWIETPAAAALLRELATRESLAALATAALRRLHEPRR